MVYESFLSVIYVISEMPNLIGGYVPTPIKKRPKHACPIEKLLNKMMVPIKAHPSEINIIFLLL